MGDVESVSESASRPQSPLVDVDYAITAVSVTPCANFLLVGGNDGLVWILRLHSLEPVHCLPRCKAPIASFGLNYDQR